MGGGRAGENNGSGENNRETMSAGEAFSIGVAAINGDVSNDGEGGKTSMAAGKKAEEAKWYESDGEMTANMTKAKNDEGDRGIDNVINRLRENIDNQRRRILPLIRLPI